MAELVWADKYDKEGRRTPPLRVALPFQTVETVNESARDRQRSLALFGSGRDPEWRNRLIWGDKKYVLPALAQELAGKVNLIYIDPPFATGQDFSFRVSIEDEEFVKRPSVIEMKAYRDTWGRGLDSYLKWFYDAAAFLWELLADDGSMYVHLDYHVAYYVKVLLDDLCGADKFQADIIWKRKDAQSFTTGFGVIHDVILFYAKGENFTFNKVFVPLSQGTADSWYTNEETARADVTNRLGQRITKGTVRRFNKADISAPGNRSGTLAHYEWKKHWPPAGRHWQYTKDVMEKLEREGRLVYSGTGRVYEKRYLDESKGTPLQSLWTDVSQLRGMSKHAAGTEWQSYETQKPEALLSRIISVSSNEGDLVLDCFCGSGTTAAVAEKLNRRWIVADLGRFAVHTTRKRLLSIPTVKPFLVQNLGKYERQLWQLAEFGNQSEARTLAYRRFILELYHAQFMTGHVWLHGVKGGRLVHVGSVDSPVTPGDVSQIAAEFKHVIGTGRRGPTTNGIDVLGWDFAFELNEVARQQAALAKIDLRFVRIPREVLDRRAVEQGDVKFLELAALSVEVAKKGRDATVTLSDFVIPLDDVPEEIQRAVRSWDQWIDYWAVDWDNKGDAFHNEWQTFRNGQNGQALDKSAHHLFESAGLHTVVVKVIDILGNDTTKTLRIEVH